MSGLSTMGSISFGCALVAGRKRVPRPATGNTALVTWLNLFIGDCCYWRGGAQGRDIVRENRGDGKFSAQPLQLRLQLLERGGEVRDALALLVDHGGRRLGHES